MASDGDIILVLKSTKILASSTALSKASPVFRAMLGPNFSEGQLVSKDKPGIIELEDDDVPAMIVLCNIIHRCIDRFPNFAEIKHYRSYSAIVGDLVLLSDKYDTASTTRLWIEESVTQLCPLKSIYVGPLLYASWVLDLPVCLERLTSRLILSTSNAQDLFDGCFDGCFHASSNIQLEQLPVALRGDFEDLLYRHRWQMKLAAAVSQRARLASNTFYAELQSMSWEFATILLNRDTKSYGTRSKTINYHEDATNCGAQFAHYFQHLHPRYLPAPPDGKIGRIGTALEYLDKYESESSNKCSPCYVWMTKSIRSFKARWQGLRGCCIGCLKRCGPNSPNHYKDCLGGWASPLFEDDLKSKLATSSDSSTRSTQDCKTQ